MVVDLAVDRQHDLVVGADQRLGPVLDVDDRQPLVGQDRPLVVPDAAPVRASVPHAARQVECGPTQIGRGRINTEDTEDRTHTYRVRNPVRECMHTVSMRDGS